MAEPRRIARGTRRIAKRLAPRSGAAGLTLIELIVAFSIMLILSVMALPVASVRIQREKERRLRHALNEMRSAIDRHKDMADEGKLAMADPNNHGYPESLEALVEGVQLGEQAAGMASGLGGIGAGPNRSVDQDARSRRPGSIGSNRDAQSPFGTGRDRTGSGAFGSSSDPFLRGGDPLEAEDEGPETIRFLRSIPMDPMTGQKEWGMLSISDDPLSRSWSGRNVFDVYSLSGGIALDGTRYSEW